MTRFRLEKGLILGSDKHVHSLNPLHFKWHAEEYRVIESDTEEFDMMDRVITFLTMKRTIGPV